MCARVQVVLVHKLSQLWEGIVQPAAGQRIRERERETASINGSTTSMNGSNASIKGSNASINGSNTSMNGRRPVVFLGVLRARLHDAHLQEEEEGGARGGGKGRRDGEEEEGEEGRGRQRKEEERGWRRRERREEGERGGTGGAQMVEDLSALLHWQGESTPLMGLFVAIVVSIITINGAVATINSTPLSMNSTLLSRAETTHLRQHIPPRADHAIRLAAAALVRTRHGIANAQDGEGDATFPTKRGMFFPHRIAASFRSSGSARSVAITCWRRHLRQCPSS